MRAVPLRRLPTRVAAVCRTREEFLTALLTTLANELTEPTTAVPALAPAPLGAAGQCPRHAHGPRSRGRTDVSGARSRGRDGHHAARDCAQAYPATSMAAPARSPRSTTCTRGSRWASLAMSRNAASGWVVIALLEEEHTHRAPPPVCLRADDAVRCAACCLLPLHVIYPKKPTVSVGSIGKPRLIHVITQD